ncbi:hypothetical protein PilKf_01134 [Pillotina sp. SPG140]
MRANETGMLEFLKGYDKRFVIPVYQRNYDWKKDNCKQLFDDLVDMIENKRKSHFFGAIVYVYNDNLSNKKNIKELIIIDGQQRITTLMLLMLALIHTQEKTKEDDHLNIDLIKDEYLIDKYTKEVKLKSIKKDAIALNTLFLNNEKDDQNSNIIVNYQYFKKLLKECDKTLSEIFSAMLRLDIVDISLKIDEDDPQLIFESLNSTGLDLSEADKIRNFILMRLSSDEQTEYYEKYWKNIEKYTDYDVSSFIRHYLTYKERSIPKLGEVYVVFKEYIHKNAHISTETILKELLIFSGYYNHIIHPNHENKKIREVLIYLNILDVKVIYPFLLELFNDCYRDNIISDNTLREILLTIESFLFRRMICEVQTRGLNTLFANLGKDIKGFNDYKNNYREVLNYVLSQIIYSQRFPDDKEVKEKMRLKDFYNIKNRLYIFYRLEYFEKEQSIDFSSLWDKKELSVDHIMPQELSEPWKSALGSNYETIHAKYLHTIGNLTVIFDDSEMGNDSFSDKKILYDDYPQNTLYLNAYINQQHTWNEATIIERADILIERALKIWKYCDNTYKNKRAIANTYSLSDEDTSFTGKKIEYFKVFGKEIVVNHWNYFLQQLCMLLYDKDPVKFKDLLTDHEIKRRSLLSNDSNTLRASLEITDGIYIEKNLSTDDIVGAARLLLNKFRIDAEEVTLHLKEAKR